MKSLDELTTRCIRCGFCLESCPTYLVTGQETESPRGRIYLVRSAEEGQATWEQARPHIERCLGCLACEPACPSGVDYSEIIEIARDRLERERPNRTKKLLLDLSSNPQSLHKRLRLASLLPGKRVPALLSKLLSGQAPEAERPRIEPQPAWPPLDVSDLPPARGEVYLLEGCAMRVLFPRVHFATRRLLRRLGFTVKETNAGCCGALHAHNGYLDDARKLATALIQRMPGELPIIVNSAGCGSVMKEYPELLDLDMQAFSNRVMDISEFLLREGLPELLSATPGLNLRATYHDACHLAHAQTVKQAPRALLTAIPDLELLPLPESDVCCGSAGIYNLTQPKLARQLLNRKWANIEATGAQLVIQGNPGCQSWIGQAAREHGGTVRVMHTAEVLESAFSGMPPAERR